jgi:hypothetical protein
MEAWKAQTFGLRELEEENRCKLWMLETLWEVSLGLNFGHEI